MTTISDPRQALIRAIDEAGWSSVAERVIRGICHDLNGRINSMTSLTYLLNTGSMEWPKVGPMVEDELKWTEELSRLLHVLPDDSRVPEVLDPGELVARVVRLVRLQPGLESVQWEVTIPPDFPATRMDETLLLRCLVLLLTGVADEGKEKEGARISIRGRSDSSTLTIEPGWAAAGRGSGAAPPGEGNWVPGEPYLPLAQVLQQMGGDLAAIRGAGTGLVLELHLPGLED
jgi:hypothetical protein